MSKAAELTREELVERWAEDIWRGILQEMRHPSGVLDWTATTKAHPAIAERCRETASQLLAELKALSDVMWEDIRREYQDCTDGGDFEEFTCRIRNLFAGN